MISVLMFKYFCKNMECFKLRLSGLPLGNDNRVLLAMVDCFKEKLKI